MLKEHDFLNFVAFWDTLYIGSKDIIANSHVVISFKVIFSKLYLL